MTWRTHSGAWCAPYSANTPPRLQPTRLTLAAGAVVQVADLLLQRLRMAALEADVAAQAPGLHVVAAPAQEQLQRRQRALVAHEARQQQHRVAVAAWQPGPAAAS
jgi:hypothetical protein